MKNHRPQCLPLTELKQRLYTRRQVLVATAGGTAAITGFCVINDNFFPPKQIRAMEMDVIPRSEERFSRNAETGV